MGKPPKIMVIDDEPDIVFLVRRHLERWGYEVETFTNPLFALEQFRKQPNAYAVVLTDISMPEINGTALSLRMLEIKPDAKIVIMTAFEITAADLREALPEIVGSDILKKPFNMTQVCTAIKQHLKTGKR